MPQENTAPYLSIGLRISAYRVRKDLLQRELAALMDIDAATLSKLESGKARATRDQARWLAVNANIAMKWWGYSNNRAMLSAQQENAK